MTTDTARAAYADRERNLAVRDALAMITTGVNDRRRCPGVVLHYRETAAGMLHRSVATQARWLGIDTTGWARPS